MASSEVERELGCRPAAADEDAAVGWWLEGIGVVRHLAREQPALAVVARPVAATEADGHVAGFGEVEQARIAVVPRRGEVAARERHDGPLAGWPRWRVRRPVAGLDDAGPVGGDRAEDLS